MERVLLLACLVAPPATTVKTYAGLTCLLGGDLQAPLLEALYSPLGSIFVGVRACYTSAEAVAEDVQMLHHLIVLLGHLLDLLYGCALCPN